MYNSFILYWRKTYHKILKVVQTPKHNYQVTASTYTYLELCNANQKWKFSRRHWNRSEEMTNFRVVSNVMTPMTFSVWGGPHHLPTNFHTKNALQYLKQAAFSQCCTKVSKMCPAENLLKYFSFTRFSGISLILSDIQRSKNQLLDTRRKCHSLLLWWDNLSSLF